MASQRPWSDLSESSKLLAMNCGAPRTGYFPITTYADVCSGEYQVKPDLSFTYEVDCTTTFITGFFTGQTLSVAGLKY